MLLTWFRRPQRAASAANALAVVEVAYTSSAAQRLDVANRMAQSLAPRISKLACHSSVQMKKARDVRALGEVNSMAGCDPGMMVSTCETSNKVGK